jgi:hypothetical protein
MSAIEELMGYKKNGLEFGILGRAILEIIERLEALEDHNVVRVHDVDKYYPEEEPAPAPDLETLVEKYFGQLTKATFDINVPVMQAFKDILRAFAEELGVK